MRATSPAVEIAATRSRRGGTVLLSVLVGCVLLLSAQAPGPQPAGLGSAVLDPVGGGSGRQRARGGLADGVRGGGSTAGTLRRDFGERGAQGEARAPGSEELFRLRAGRARRSAIASLATAAAALPNVLTSAPVLLIERRAGLQSALVGGRLAARAWSRARRSRFPRASSAGSSRPGGRSRRAQLLIDALGGGRRPHRAHRRARRRARRRPRRAAAEQRRRRRRACARATWSSPRGSTGSIRAGSRSAASRRSPAAATCSSRSASCRRRTSRA